MNDGPEEGKPFFPPAALARTNWHPPTQWPEAEMAFLDFSTRRAWCVWMVFRGISPGCNQSKVHWEDVTKPEDLTYLFGDY